MNYDSLYLWLAVNQQLANMHKDCQKNGGTPCWHRRHKMSKCQCPSGLIGKTCGQLAMGGGMGILPQSGVALGFWLFVGWFLLFMIIFCILKDWFKNKHYQLY